MEQEPKLDENIRTFSNGREAVGWAALNLQIEVEEKYYDGAVAIAPGDSFVIVDEAGVSRIRITGEEDGEVSAELLSNNEGGTA